MRYCIAVSMCYCVTVSLSLSRGCAFQETLWPPVPAGEGSQQGPDVSLHRCFDVSLCHCVAVSLCVGALPENTLGPVPAGEGSQQGPDASLVVLAATQFLVRIITFEQQSSRALLYSDVKYSTMMQ